MELEKDNFYIKKKHIDTLFRFIKNKKEEEFLEYITAISPSEIDLNIKDSFGNYLINYVCLLNYPRCLISVLKFDCRLDIIDDNGRSLLYYPIKFDYTEVFNILLNSKLVGSYIYDIVDKFDKTPLYYAIDNKNYACLQELVTKGANTDLISKFDGDTPFLYSIKIRDYVSMNILLRNTNLLNIQNNKGYTCLHYLVYNHSTELVKKLLDLGATQYLGEFTNGYTPIFYSIFKEYNDISLLLINNNNEKFDYNYQDYEGNTLFHIICIFEKLNNFEIYVSNLTKNISLFNFNITNIDGDTVLHYLLHNIDKIEKSSIELFVKNTNLNIQNNNGDTPLHFISKYDLWEEFEPILSHKVLYPFIANKFNKTAYDFIILLSKAKADNILTNSIINNTKKKNLIDKCKLDDSQTNSDCITEIQNAIYNKDTRIFSKYSSISVDTYTFVPFTTFTGSQIDQFFGFYYLKLKFSKLDIPMYNQRKIGERTKKAYNILGIKIGMNQFFLDFDIKWITRKLILPDNFEERITAFAVTNSHELLIYPINIILVNGEHSNLLIFDKPRKTCYRFEPHGSVYLNSFNYNPDSLDNVLKEKIKNVIGYSYMSPDKYLPIIGFQTLDTNELDTNHNIGDPNGFCLLWSIWYSYYRVKYTEYDVKKLSTELIRQIRLKNITYRNLLRNFSKEITDLRDMYLEKYKYNINDYLNNRVSYETITDIINDCLSKFEN